MPVAFTCNICARETLVDSLEGVESLEDIDAEKGSCIHCGSNVRFRWIIHTLSSSFFGRSLLLKDFPEAKHINGIGLSDGEVYAGTLSNKFTYTNTYYHCEPQFNVKDLSYAQPSSLDFIIASEVFEHVAPPVQPAFDNLSRLLKPDGIILFTTPWRRYGFTVEHFPELLDWTLVTFRDKHVLLNQTQAGELQSFTNLRFHGGPGETLEMRIFSQADLMKNFHAAGLAPQIMANPVPEFGIVYREPWSLPFIVRKVSHIENGPYATDSAGEPENARLQREMEALYVRLDSENNWVHILTQRLTKAEAQVNELSQQQQLAKDSKWLRLGNRLGLGPKLG